MSRDDKHDEELPGMLAVAKGVAEQKFPHTMDAAVWAAEFVKLNPEADEGLMLSWFANAIMAGYDTRAMRESTPSSIAAMDRLRPDVIKIRNDEARAVLGEIMAYVTTDQRIRELIEKRIEERGLSDPAPVSATGASDVQRQDMTRLEWLSELLKHCPHAELIYNDEDGADGPVGFSLHVQSCTTMQLHAPTLEALIDLGMSAEPDEDGDVIATADDTAKNYAPPTKAGM